MAIQKADRVAGNRDEFVQTLQLACRAYATYPSPDNFQKVKAAVERYEQHTLRWIEAFNQVMGK